MEAGQAVTYESGIVRVAKAALDLPTASLGVDLPTAGLGVLIDHRHVLTCAHVVNAALGRQSLTERECPNETDTVLLEFPIASGSPLRRSRVTAWNPPQKSASADADLAVLELTENSPELSVPAQCSATPKPGTELRVFGYPGDPPRDDGSWVNLVVKGQVDSGLLQVESKGDQTVKAQPGFSGSPVWDDRTGLLAGLLVSTPLASEPARDARLIPASELERFLNAKMPLFPVSPAGRPSRLKELGWGFVLESFVDATLCLVDDSDAVAEIEHQIRDNSAVPTRYHYSAEMGAQRWLRLCKNDNYRFRANTMAYWLSEAGESMAKKIRESVGSERRLDFVSLGPGDGEKDATLILEWLNAGVDVMYYPYDISLKLAAHAAHCVRERTAKSDRGSLHVKVVLADFYQLDRMLRLFDHRRDVPNVYSLLGTLGNLLDDRLFLAKMRGWMEPKDLLLLEVRLKSPELAKEEELFESDENSLRHDFGPLEHYFGLRFDKSLFRKPTPRRTGLSRIDEKAETMVVTYVGPAPAGKAWPKEGVRLQYIHEYDSRTFLKEVNKMGFEIVDESTSDKGFLVCLLRCRS